MTDLQHVEQGLERPSTERGLFHPGLPDQFEDGAESEADDAGQWRRQSGSGMRLDGFVRIVFRIVGNSCRDDAIDI